MPVIMPTPKTLQLIEYSLPEGASEETTILPDVSNSMQ
jgi:hypothetical protein